MYSKLSGHEKLAAHEYRRQGLTLYGIRAKLDRADVSIMCIHRAVKEVGEVFDRITEARRTGDYSRLDFMEVCAADSDAQFLSTPEGLPYSQARVDEARRTGDFTVCRRLDEALAALSKDGKRLGESEDANANQE